LSDETVASLSRQGETRESSARIQALGVMAILHSRCKANARDQYIGQSRGAGSHDVELRLRPDRFANALIHLPILEHGLCNGGMPCIDKRGI
jgi:hypothetical protein